MARAAGAHAALGGRTEVTMADVRAVAKMSLRHRLRRGPLDAVDGGDEVMAALQEFLPAGARADAVDPVAGLLAGVQA